MARRVEAAMANGDVSEFSHPADTKRVTQEQIAKLEALVHETELALKRLEDSSPDA